MEREREKKMCGAWVSGLGLEAGGAVGGGGKTHESSGQACGPEWMVWSMEAESGLAVDVCHCLEALQKPWLRILGLYTTRVKKGRGVGNG